jgi:hypothetical protein
MQGGNNAQQITVRSGEQEGDSVMANGNKFVCENVRSRLNEYVGHEKEENMKEIGEHLENCSECFDEYFSHLPHYIEELAGKLVKQ